jgi:hypothetical protein
MPYVKNKVTGFIHQVPEKHFSLTDKDYEVISNPFEVKPEEKKIKTKIKE